MVLRKRKREKEGFERIDGKMAAAAYPIMSDVMASYLLSLGIPLAAIITAYIAYVAKRRTDAAKRNRNNVVELHNVVL